MTSPPAPSSPRDLRGHALGSHSPAAAQAVETALGQMMAYSADPQPALEAARAEDPAWVLPPLMLAGHLLSLTEPAHAPQVQALLQQAEACAGSATPRERAHLEAVNALADGRWHHACRLWDDLLLDHPRDALALHWAQLWDLQRGDTVQLRLRPARALPEWDEDDPLYPFVLGLHAFGLQENNLHAQAEDTARRAVSGGTSVPWAVHAMTHVMEAQGRFEDGTAWLRQHQPGWAEGNAFASHLWWHMGLFRLEAMDLPGVQRLIDAHLCGDALQSTLPRLDAAAMLWRLHLLGVDMRARFAELLQGWQPRDEDAGQVAFNDLHVLLTLLGAGEPGRAEAWIGRCAARAMAPEDVRRANHATAREVGLPLMRGLLSLARGEADAAVATLRATRAQAHRLGGSHAQRDLIDQSLLAAAVQAGDQPVGRALLNERRLAKPITPLTRHWAQQLGQAL